MGPFRTWHCQSTAPSSPTHRAKSSTHPIGTVSGHASDDAARCAPNSNDSAMDDVLSMAGTTM